ncbi:Epoxyqueuosine reductase [Methylobacterium iners]|uniref:Epoxyqueuosine reductase n=1 Tax=Methylobacterium iners TaxID=418707 RepID=A0ABQ4S0R0_9HYPH|nr:Epoxyqueuosine reductase [Methylobacterium iners]
MPIDDPALEGERPHVLRCFPATRTLLVIVKRMHRGPVRSPDRSVANHEFHSSGHAVDEVARAVVGRLEDMDIDAVNPAMAFPMELDGFPGRGWVVSHKIAAEAAGLGRMGIHRSLIHPRFGSFVLLGTVLVAADVAAEARTLDFNPCLECKLCVAACPVGAIKPDGYFDFSACLTHNYQQFMGGFVNWVEDVADSGSAAAYGERVSYAETVQRWQSLSYGPNYNAAYCIAVCPAGEDVIGPYLDDRKGFTEAFLRPLQRKVEPIYVVKDTDAEAHVAKRFPHKRVRRVRPSGRATTIANFLMGMPLGFQRGRAEGLAATYHFSFTGAEQVATTVIIRDRTLAIRDGHVGTADLRVVADARTWIRFLNHEVSLLRCLATRRLRIKGPPRLLAAFGRCFPT